MDAGRRRRLGWRRRRRARTDARLPALDRLAARAGVGDVGKCLSGAGGYSAGWARACPPGSHGGATSSIQAPSPMNYLAVRLKAGERWTYKPPAEHTVLWSAVGMGSVLDAVRGENIIDLVLESGAQ